MKKIARFESQKKKIFFLFEFRPQYFVFFLDLFWPDSSCENIIFNRNKKFSTKMRLRKSISRKKNLPPGKGRSKKKKKVTI